MSPLVATVKKSKSLPGVPEESEFRGPMLTPTRDGSMMVLLSPCRTITETLSNLASSTAQQLENTWDWVGYSPEDRAAQLNDLLVQFKTVCEQKVAEERAVAETFTETIQQAKDELRVKSQALQVDVDPALFEEQEGTTLSDELATLEAALEGLRAQAEEAQAELRDCRDFLVEAHDLLGIDIDPTYLDIENDWTSHRRARFQEKRDELQRELATRTAAIVQLLQDCNSLLRDLRMEDSESEVDQRILGSLVRSKEGTTMLADKARSATCTGIHSDAMEELTTRVAELHGEKRRRKKQLQDMGAEIANLWEKLHVSEEEQLAFTESVHGLGLDTIAKGKNELDRLRVMKSEMLGRLIKEAREKIDDLWEQVNIVTSKRREFAPYYVYSESQWDDELLEKHETYIDQLEERLEQMKPIIDIIEKREVIIDERMEYEELQKDPERLKQRNATRQLMKEEKMAKRIKRDLPHLTQVLRARLEEWKQSHGEDFVYKGAVYLETMDDQEDEWNNYKEEELQRRLKKKQEEKAFVENRYMRPAAIGKKKKKPTRPLGDANHRDPPSRNTRVDLSP